MQPVTYEEAMAWATDRIDDQSHMLTVDLLAHWLNVARELREAQAGPLLDRVLARADSALPTSAQRVPAVQDVEADICVGHEAIAVRLPGASSRWWHPRLRTWCDDVDYREPDQAAPSARIPMPVAARDQDNVGGETQRLEDHLHIPLPAEAATQVMGALRNCYRCGQTIAYDDTISGWRHVASGQRVCVGPEGDGVDDTIIYAWPAAIEIPR